jgi:hypothetical protein
LKLSFGGDDQFGSEDIFNSLFSNEDDDGNKSSSDLLSTSNSVATRYSFQTNANTTKNNHNNNNKNVKKGTNLKPVENFLEEKILSIAQERLKWPILITTMTDTTDEGSTDAKDGDCKDKEESNSRKENKNDQFGDEIKKPLLKSEALADLVSNIVDKVTNVIREIKSPYDSTQDGKFKPSRPPMMSAANNSM